MNFYQSVLLKKKNLENISKKVRFRDNYPLLFTLSDQIYDSHSKYCFIYVRNLWSCKINLKYFKFW